MGQEPHSSIEHQKNHEKKMLPSFSFQNTEREKYSSLALQNDKQRVQNTNTCVAPPSHPIRGSSPTAHPAALLGSKKYLSDFHSLGG